MKDKKMIVQGTNLPLVIKFTQGIPNYSYIEISLRYDGEEIKHWDKDSVTVIENSILCPLSQKETRRLDVGTYRIEVKLLDSSGATRFMTTKKIGVSPHYDTTIMGDGDASFISECSEEIIADVSTGKIIYKGYSPYIGENGNWYVWSDESGEFIDTEVYASIPAATTESIGLVKPDGESVQIEEDGTIHATQDLSLYAKMEDLDEYAKTSDVVLKDSYETWVLTDRLGNEYTKLVYVKG